MECDDVMRFMIGRGYFFVSSLWLCFGKQKRKILQNPAKSSIRSELGTYKIRYF